MNRRRGTDDTSGEGRLLHLTLRTAVAGGGCPTRQTVGMQLLCAKVLRHVV